MEYIDLFDVNGIAVGSNHRPADNFPQILTTPGGTGIPNILQTVKVCTPRTPVQQLSPPLSNPCLTNCSAGYTVLSYLSLAATFVYLLHG